MGEEIAKALFAANGIDVEPITDPNHMKSLTS